MGGGGKSSGWSREAGGCHHIILGAVIVSISLSEKEGPPDDPLLLQYSRHV